MAFTGQPYEANEPLKNSNIAYIRTDLKWLDIKIVDPEMENLVKQVNEEHLRLKEVLREKLRLLRYDVETIQRENDQAKQKLLEKGVQFELYPQFESVSLAPVIKEEIDIPEESLSLEFECNDNIDERISTHTVPQSALKNVEVSITRLQPDQLTHCNIENFEKWKEKRNSNKKEKEISQDNSGIQKRQDCADRPHRDASSINCKENSNDNEKKHILYATRRQMFRRELRLTLERRKRMKSKRLTHRQFMYYQLLQKQSTETIVKKTKKKRKKIVK